MGRICTSLFPFWTLVSDNFRAGINRSFPTAGIASSRVLGETSFTLRNQAKHSNISCFCTRVAMEPASSEEENTKGKRQTLDSAKQAGPSKRAKMDSPKDKSHHNYKHKVFEPARKTVGFDQVMFNETGSYIENGLRKVRPYFFTFEAFAKGRWLGRTVMDVFRSEFRAHPPEHYEKAIKMGRLLLNGECVKLDTVLRDNDFMQNTVHRHEPPVVADPVQIVEENADLVVINKPASMPVHPCGGYRHNSVIFVLGKEHGFQNLHPIHRLDRLTSGILIFAKNIQTKHRLDAQIKGREVKKVYLARVLGEFPENAGCDKPILAVKHKLGVCRVCPEGKPAKTSFERVSFNGVSSVVRCFPETGRMHQIRVHLQYLGYPIVNDPLYNSAAWGFAKGKGGIEGTHMNDILGKLVQEETERLQGASSSANDSTQISQTHPSNTEQTSEQHGDLDSQDSAEGSRVKDQEEETEKNLKSVVESNPSDSSQTSQATSSKTGETPTEQDGDLQDSTEGPKGKGQGVRVDPICEECRVSRRDPTPKELVMYLHALSYEGEGWSYKTPPPTWASDDWAED